ncbi:hypothetical protein [Actinomadura rugatobispora]|uniref:Uncharacterized protein n=1 Tax=Actinomadura rugatobispora TaxID=1994 RepID=A0ABW1A260_9ACTN|nr:hypothetical protein GCM10010200_100410 [Actinomadura rugatobispora]
MGGEDADHAGVAFGDGRSVVVGAGLGFVDLVLLGVLVGEVSACSGDAAQIIGDLLADRIR